MNQSWTLFLLLVTMLEDIVLAASMSHVHTVHGQATSDITNSSTSLSSGTFSEEWPDDIKLGCKELRAKRFISDGFCTSLKPIKEVVCAGQCMPIKEQNLPWWTEFTKYWAKPKLKEWRCVEAVTKRRKVQLMCQNGETRTYKIKVVKSCRCKAYEREPNRTEDPRNRLNKKGKDRNKDKKKGKRNRHKIDKKERRRLRRLRKNSRSSKMARRNSDSSSNRDRREKSRRQRVPVIITNDSPVVAPAA